MSSKRLVQSIILIIVIALIILFYLFLVKPSWFPLTGSRDQVQPVYINTDNQPRQGDADSPIKIVVFGDLKCSNCKRFDQTLMPWIRSNYVVTGKASYTMIVVSFLPDSMQAAVGAYCAAQQSTAAFYQYVDILYHNQGAETENWANTAKLLQLASDVDGLDQDTFSTCLMDSNNVAVINKNTDYASQIMNGRLATPAVYVNGILVQPLNEEQFKKVVDQTT